MRRALSLIIGIGVTAFAVLAPAALGEGRVGGLQPQATPPSYRDAGERAVLVLPGVQVDRRTDAWDREGVPVPQSTYRDGAERAAPVATVGGAYVDANERGSGPATPTVVVATDSGIDVAWPQVAVALGLGLALGVGLLFALGSTRHGPLAH